MSDAPLSPELVAGAGAVADPRWSPDGARLAWLRTGGAGGAGGEGVALVVAPSGGTAGPRTVPLDPAPASTRSTGGGVLAWAGPDRLVVSAGDGRLLSVPLDGTPARVIAAGDGRISAPAVAPDGSLVAFVLDADDACTVMVAPMDGAQPPRRISEADYAWDPAWSRTGLLAWHEWDFPDMSWDASRIVVADRADGFARRRVVAGGDGTAVGQPRFGPRGDDLAYVSDESGWWNVWLEPEPRAGPSRGRRAVLAEPNESAEPAWGVGQRSFAWSPGGDAFALTRNEDGFGRLVVVARDADGRRDVARDVAKGWHHGLDWGPAGIAAVRSGGRTPPALTVLAPDGDGRSVLDGGPAVGLDTDALREPEPVTWTAGDGATVHGLLWRPAGAGPDAPAPPLIVDVHGGPTGQATVSWSPRTHFFTSRGWAVLQPNPRGSSGYGRAYLQALMGGWGELDVDDVAAGIRAAATRGWCDPSRVAVTGGSSGGMLALLLCARHAALVRAAVVQYPVTDLVDLAATTHRFESHYSDRLVGELPRDEIRYRDRSPITHAARIRTPLLVLQGDADPVVSPAEVDRFVAAVRAAGGTVEYHQYAGEGHGWSRRETVLDALSRTETFLAAAFSAR